MLRLSVSRSRSLSLGLLTSRLSSSKSQHRGPERRLDPEREIDRRRIRDARGRAGASASRSRARFPLVPHAVPHAAVFDVARLAGYAVHRPVPSHGRICRCHRLDGPAVPHAVPPRGPLCRRPLRHPARSCSQLPRRPRSTSSGLTRGRLCGLPPALSTRGALRPCGTSRGTARFRERSRSWRSSAASLSRAFEHATDGTAGSPRAAPSLKPSDWTGAWRQRTVLALDPLPRTAVQSLCRHNVTFRVGSIVVVMNFPSGVYCCMCVFAPLRKCYRKGGGTELWAGFDLMSTEVVTSAILAIISAASIPRGSGPPSGAVLRVRKLQRRSFVTVWIQRASSGAGHVIRPPGFAEWRHPLRPNPRRPSFPRNPPCPPRNRANRQLRGCGQADGRLRMACADT